jgi:lysozyme family protein
MKANREFAYTAIFFDEGGWVVRDTEPGGAGNYGISFALFCAYEHLHGNAKPTFDDLKNLKRADAEAIYDAEVLTPLHFDDMPNGTDYALADAGVTLGVTGAIKLLQKCLNLPIDGHLGIITQAAVMKADPKTFPLTLCDAWLAEKEASVPPAEAKRWHIGWEFRHLKVRARIGTLLEGTGDAGVA